VGWLRERKHSKNYFHVRKERKEGDEFWGRKRCKGGGEKRALDTLTAEESTIGAVVLKKEKSKGNSLA